MASTAGGRGDIRTLRADPTLYHRDPAKGSAQGSGRLPLWRWDGQVSSRVGVTPVFWHRWRLIVIALWVIVAAVAVPRALHVTHGLSGSG